jgi:tetratricopeptide (TPR) repeat protein
VAADLTGVRTAHDARQVTPLSVARGDLSRRFIEIVDQATAPDPAARIQTADDLQRALAAFVEAADPVSARARRHRLAAAAAVVIAALAVGSAVVGPMASRWTHGGRPFQARDWLIVTNFDNRTGDDRLNGTVEFALERELKESAFVNVVPRERIGDTLRLMKLPLDTAIDRTRGLEICLRDGGIRGLVTGRIEKVGSSYSIAAAVIDSRSKGRTLASVGAQAADEARILDAVHQLSSHLRTAVGEWPNGQPSAPERLERVTTGSLQSLRVYTQGMKAVNAYDWATAVEFLQQATSQDAHFASAEIYLAHALRNLGSPSDVYLPPARRAVADADQTTDRERYFILGSYSHMIGDHSKAIAYYEALVRRYPDDFWGVNNLYVEYSRDPRYQQERGRIGRVRLAMRPNDFTLNALLALDVVFTDGFDAARPYVRRAREILDAGASPIDPPSLRSYILLFPAHESWAVGRAAEASVRLDAAAAQPTIASDDYAQVRLGSLRLTLGQLSLAGQSFERIRDPFLHTIEMANLALARDDFGSVIKQLGDYAGRDVAPVSLLVRAGALREARQVLARASEVSDQHMQWSAAEIEEASGNQRTIQAALKAGAPWTHVMIGTRAFLYSETLARSAADAGQIDDAIAVLEETGRLRDKQYLSLTDNGYFWLRTQLLLSDLYRRVGRVADARTIEADLRQRLAVADSDFPLLAELNRRQ